MNQPVTRGCVAMIPAELIPDHARLRNLHRYRSSVSVVVDEIAGECATVRYTGVKDGGFSVPLDALVPIRAGSPPDDRGMALWNGIHKVFGELVKFPGVRPDEVTDLELLGELVFDARRYLPPQFLSVDLVELAHEIRRFLQERKKSSETGG